MPLARLLALDRILCPGEAVVKGTVVLFDDDNSVREGFSALFEHTGLDVHATGSFVEFHSLVARHDPDLVLVDVHLAALKGNEIVAIARKRLNATVILFSGVSRVELAELSAACGADGFLSKMDSTDDILTRVMEWVRQGRKRRGYAADDESRSNEETH